MKRSDISVVAVIYAICLFFFILTLDLPEEAQTYPLCLIAGLFFLNTVYIGRALLVYRRERAMEDDIAQAFGSFQARQFFGSVALGVLYMVLLWLVGFYVSTILYLTAAMLLLQDLDKDTVDFAFNYDDTLKEPVLLPARYPNLLVNGTSGIAVGLATNIPPHNPGEVIDAVIAVLEDPSVSLEEILRILPAPDFPTGGYLMDSPEIREAYETGRGKLTVRAKTHFEELKNGKKLIVITEIPYLVNKQRLIGKIAPQVHRTGKAVFACIHRDIVRDAFRPEVVLRFALRAMERQVVHILMQQAGACGIPSPEQFDVIPQAAVKRVRRFGNFRLVAEIRIDIDRRDIFGDKSFQCRACVRKIGFHIIQDGKQPFTVRVFPQKLHVRFRKVPYRGGGADDIRITVLIPAVVFFPPVFRLFRAAGAGSGQKENREQYRHHSFHHIFLLSDAWPPVSPETRPPRTIVIIPLRISVCPEKRRDSPA